MSSFTKTLPFFFTVMQRLEIDLAPLASPFGQPLWVVLGRPYRLKVFLSKKACQVSPSGREKNFRQITS